MAARKPLFHGPLPWLKPGVVIGALTPLAVLAIRGATGNLQAHAEAQILNQFGYLALLLLTATMSCTPLKRYAGWTWPMRLRRTLGLLCFFYACCHFVTYVAFDQGLDLAKIVEDVAKRKFILVGFLAFLTLIPLAVTSTDASVKRLGYQRWQRLHRLIYLTVVLAVLHFVWRVKADLTRPLFFAALFGVLFAARIAAWLQKSMRARSR